MAELRAFLESRESSDEAEALKNTAQLALEDKKADIMEQQRVLAQEIDDLFFADDLPGINLVSEWLIDELVDSDALDS